MTYILDLQHLWNDRTQITPSMAKAAHSLALDPRQHIVSVILVANSPNEETFLPALQSIVSQWFIREIIVVCPEDFKLEKHLEKFSTLHPRCFSVLAKKSMNLAQAYNLGAQYASGQFLLFMDSPTILEKSAVLKLLSIGIRKPLPWVVGVKAHSDKHFNKVISKLTEFPLQQLPEVSLPGGGVHALNVANSIFLIPIKTFVELKGMDQKFPENAFQLDFCLRIHLASGSVYEVRDMKVENIHQPSKRSLYQIISKEWQILRAMYYFYQKYVSKKQILFTKISI